MAHAAGNGTRTPAPFRTSRLPAPYDDGSTDSAGLPHRTTAVFPAEPHAATAPPGRVMFPHSTALKGNRRPGGQGPSTGDGSIPVADGAGTGRAAGPVGRSSRPAARPDAVVRDGTPRTAPRPAGAPLPVLVHGGRPAL
ncbi:hypothetical protein [Streptomyces sp. NPDC054765]